MAADPLISLGTFDHYGKVLTLKKEREKIFLSLDLPQTDIHISVFNL